MASEILVTAGKKYKSIKKPTCALNINSSSTGGCFGLSSPVAQQWFTRDLNLDPGKILTTGFRGYQEKSSILGSIMTS